MSGPPRPPHPSHIADRVWVVVGLGWGQGNHTLAVFQEDDVLGWSPAALWTLLASVNLSQKGSQPTLQC